MPFSYLSYMDKTIEMNYLDMTWYQGLIFLIHWSTEIVRVDIMLEVSLIYQYRVSPREENMEKLLRMFLLLKNNPKKSV